jgi:peptidoglycan/xylan/chitin deacetylase (PgdA/CDA1 family)
VFEVALPLLHKYQCPATVFLPTGYMADQRPFWWDVLSLIFLQMPDIPRELDLQFGGHRLQIALGPAEARRAAHDQIWALLKLQDESSRCEAIAAIEAWAGASDPSWARAHRCVTADEAMRAHSTGFLDLGAHTRTHPSLPSLATDQQKEEIAGSVAVLREMIGSEMSSFAYPYGDYDAQVVDAVQEAGIRCACTTRHHRVGRRAPLLELPRLYVQNVDASGFSSEILAHA